jgi:spermidine/putrescine transport system permease protein
MACGLEGLCAMNGMLPQGRARLVALATTIVPGVGWIAFFLLLPVVLVVLLAFASTSPEGTPTWPPALEGLRQAAGFGILGFSDGNLRALLRSVVQALMTTAACAVLAYGVVFFILSRPAAWRGLLLLAVVVPSWTNQVVRAYAWMQLLGPEALLSRLAQYVGLIPPHLGLYPSYLAVFLGLVYNFLPYMVVPLYAAAERIDWTLLEAGSDLYATGWRLFRHAVLPQTYPGLLSGIILVLIPTFGNFVVPQLLGGNKATMLGNLIANQFTINGDWPYGSALTLIMLVMTLLAIFFMRRLGNRQGGAVAL